MEDKKISIYTTPTCPWCKKAKDYLQGKGVQYTEHNVAEDRDKLDEMVQLTGQRGVPVIIAGDQVIVGFNESKINEALSA